MILRKPKDGDKHHHKFSIDGQVKTYKIFLTPFILNYFQMLSYISLQFSYINLVVYEYILITLLCLKYSAHI